MGKPFVIYHGGCQDGFGAAFSAWMKLGWSADYLAAAHGDSPPGVKGRDVYILDYSWKRDQILELNKKADSLKILDHHVSSQQDLEGLDFAYFDLTKSGARLSWEHFHPNEAVPDLILYIEDRDLWKWELPDSQAITAALETYPMDFKVWKKWFQEGVHQLKVDGQAILRYQEQTVKRITRKPEEIMVAGFKVPSVNCPILSSEIGNVLCQNKPFSVVWRESYGKRTFSMRSDEKGEDVSKIAIAFGGGGHPHAAGFTVASDHDISKWPESDPAGSF